MTWERWASCCSGAIAATRPADRGTVVPKGRLEAFSDGVIAIAVVSRVTGGAMWANLHLLFWLSLIPFSTAWMSEHRFPPIPTAVYGIVLLCAAISYYILQTMLIRGEGESSVLRTTLGSDVRGKIGPLLYCIGIAVAFEARWVALGVYVVVALIWLVPDRRVERHVSATAAESQK
jgi:uncharacterized membrane protein